MPEYQYRCTLCSTKFSIFRPMSESWEVYCPKCKSEHLERIFFPTPAVYSGKGFYKTDNRIPLTDDE